MGEFEAFFLLSLDRPQPHSRGSQEGSSPGGTAMEADLSPLNTGKFLVHTGLPLRKSFLNDSL